MARTGLDERPARARIVAAAVALLAAAVVAASPAPAQAGESFAAALDHEPPAEWPAFTVATDDAPRPMSDDGTPGSALKSTTAVSAPLPQAVATGLVMLAGNWIGTHLWKKRKI